MNTTTIDPIISLALHGAFTNAVDGDYKVAREWLDMADKRAITLYGGSENVPTPIWDIVRDMVKLDYPQLLDIPVIRDTIGEWGAS
jgi:hypothetical protein